jgi:hypothetical protein
VLVLIVGVAMVATGVHVAVMEEDSPLIPELIRWTHDRFAGEEPTPNCHGCPTLEPAFRAPLVARPVRVASRG